MMWAQERLSLEGSVEDSNGLESLKYIKDVISRFACKKEILRQQITILPYP